MLAYGTLVMDEMNTKISSGVTLDDLSTSYSCGTLVVLIFWFELFWHNLYSFR